MPNTTSPRRKSISSPTPQRGTRRFTSCDSQCPRWRFGLVVSRPRGHLDGSATRNRPLITRQHVDSVHFEPDVRPPEPFRGVGAGRSAHWACGMLPHGPSRVCRRRGAHKRTRPRSAQTNSISAVRRVRVAGSRCVPHHSLPPRGPPRGGGPNAASGGRSSAHPHEGAGERSPWSASLDRLRLARSSRTSGRAPRKKAVYRLAAGIPL